MEGHCHNCNKHYKSLETHWGKSSCNTEPLTDKQFSVSDGLILGDGCVTGQNRLLVVNTNEEYLQYLDSVFGQWSSGVKLRNTGDVQAEMSQKSGFDRKATDRDYSDVYYMRTKRHSYFNKMRDKWYGSGEKVVPSEISIDSVAAKHWYVCDGTLRHRDNDRRRESVEISSTFNVDRLSKELQNHGFTPSYTDKYSRIELSVTDSEKFFDWVGGPVEGFKYKWPKDRL